MDDVILKAKIDAETILYVSPIAASTYEEHVEDDNLGGDRGYFVLRELLQGTRGHLEVLAKAPSLDAATVIFDMIVAARRALA